ncbi:hypothetical protein DL96DRAFT_1813865 [Flagelloscypha sp. PMI_526]|nr:hypothetical protein DL96DRAFT_1813865 [Flagelloscypha sp. PMI_526]
MAGNQARLFSRLQLAAALIEYDNDIEGRAKRNAKESAVFAHLRPGFILRPRTQSQNLPRQSGDFLGVSLPSDGDAVSVSSRSILDGTTTKQHARAASRASVDMLRNPFAQDDGEEEEEEDVEDQLGEEPDFSSWGLEAYMEDSKDKSHNAKGKGRAATSPLPIVPGPSSPSAPRSPQLGDEIMRRQKMRSRSVGEMDTLVQPAHIRDRRHSFGSPLDTVDKEPIPIDSFRSASYGIPDGGVSVPLQDRHSEDPISVPFPTSGPSERAVSPMPMTHTRTKSNASLGSQNLLDDPHRHARTNSNATMGTAFFGDDDNPFALRAPSVISRFDPKGALMAAHERNKSTTSFGPSPSIMSMGPAAEPRPLSTMELLRPKVLIMPSPLQNAPPPPSGPSSQPPISQGFRESKTGPPLPPGAKSARPSSVVSSSGFASSDALAPTAHSNSLIPNPRVTLSLSQLTFRNTLRVDGQHDAAYSDLGLPAVTVDGEQAILDPDVERDPTIAEQEEAFTGRPAGKLYGRSLIDDLENRKVEMKSKQRTFQGDVRPAMSNRGSSRGGPLIDPTSLAQRPGIQRLSSFNPQGADLGRHPSQRQPLLNFESQEHLELPPQQQRPGATTKSVFGHDPLWEREMEKLKLIEAAEAEERQRVQAQEEEMQRKGKRKGKKKKKGEVEEPPSPLESEALIPDVPRVSASAPSLPLFESPLAPGPRQEEEEESDEEDAFVPRKAASTLNRRWSSGSSDAGGKKRNTIRPSPSNPRLGQDDSDEEDLPLAATINRALGHQRSFNNNDSDEEDAPLSTVMARKVSGGAPSIQLSGLSPTRSQSFLGMPTRDDSDDDDQPLGLRASRALSPSLGFRSPLPSAAGPGGDSDEDDKPLGMHPEQQRRSAYIMAQQQQHQMMQQQQQQQQMMMMAAAAQQSAMFLNPPSMNMSGFFQPPSMGMGMGGMGMMGGMATPPAMPMHDVAKVSKIDQWRRDVAVEGSE